MFATAITQKDHRKFDVHIAEITEYHVSYCVARMFRRLQEQERAVLALAFGVGNMDKMFGPAYTGDPGVPHSGKEMFLEIFWGSIAFSVYSMVNPYYWQRGNGYK
eukprot:Gb_12666 [translate_table: standard]